MLKGLATWFLNNYLGNYLEDLNTDQLRIALSQGQVELENAPLRRDAFRFVDSSLDVRVGFVGHIRLKVPVAKIRSEPWILLLEKIYIVLGPQKFKDFDEESEEASSLDNKLVALDGIEAEWRAIEDVGHYESWKTQGSSFIATILENLQVNIRDVHIRYEDEFTSSRPFSCGIILQSLSAETCDENWLPRFVYRDHTDQTHVFKTLELLNLSLYLNDGDTEMYGNSDIPLLSEKMSSKDKLNYLLKPVSLSATIKRNCQFRPLNSKKSPRFVIDIRLNSIPLEISNSQYACALHGIRAYHQLRKNRRVWKWRPRECIYGHSKMWWQYAITCHMERIHKKNLQYSLTNVLKKGKENVRYVEAFKKYLKDPVGISQDLKRFKDTLDASRSYEELKSLREAAVFQLKNELVPSMDSEHKRKLTWTEWWYGIDESLESPKEEEEPFESDDEGEGALYYHKDAVVARINFTLESGSLKLYFTKSSDEKTEIFELEFEKMKTNFESRPRTESYKFELSLGALYLRDRISTEASMFPVLVSPANVQGAPLCPSRNRYSLGRFAKSILGNFSDIESPLFSALIETNPSANIDIRVVCRSQALNIIYNPIIVHFISDFFKIPADLNKSSNLSEKIRSAALHTIEEAKQITKEKFKRNLNYIFDQESLDSEESFYSRMRKWDITFELSAPQILIPESFVDKNSHILVVDFGKLNFSNSNMEEKKPTDQKSKENEEEEEDEFCTPASTPEELLINQSDPRPSVTNASKIDSSRFYVSFSLCLSDMQIIISRIKDNWKHAHLKGTSSLHILDKFSIQLQLDQSVSLLSDPEFPNLVITGSLPRLVVHVNEDKIFAMQRMGNLIRGDYNSSSNFRSNSQSVGTQTNNIENEYEVFDKIKKNNSTIFNSWRPPNKTEAYTKLLLLYFCINDLSVELQSQDKSIAEIQVMGVRTSLTRRPYDTNISMSVHSLLVVDAVQTFGPNFELLVASHRNVSVDSASGSLRGSEPATPGSPFTPDISTSPSENISSFNIHKALASLQSKRTSEIRGFKTSAMGSNLNLILPEIMDPDALIAIDVLIVSPDCPQAEDTNEQMNVVSIQFNSLDVIANQETIIELIAFSKRIFPEETNLKSHRLPLKDSGTQTTEGGVVNSYFGAIGASSSRTEDLNVIKSRTELNAEFQRLNVLLLRAVTGKMIGTALLTEVKVFSTIGQKINVSGSLGGLHVMNLLSGSSLHQKIVSIGKNPLVENDGNLFDEHLHAGLYSSSNYPNEEAQAFTFDVHQKDNLGHTKLEDRDVVSLNVYLRIASVCYLHSPTFIEEINSCASDFKQYMANLASSIRSAATEMALGIVQRRTDSISYSDTFPFKLNKTNDRDSLPGSYAPAPTPRVLIATKPNRFLDLDLDIVMETPIIVLPSHERSFEVLVAHLGEIIIRNEILENDEVIDRYIIDIHDMNLYSMDLRAKYEVSDLLDLIAHFKILTAKELYSYNSQYSIPILHNTAINLTIDKGSINNDIHESESFQSFGGFEDINSSGYRDIYDIRLKVTEALKFSLNRSQYEQILESTKSSSPHYDEVPTHRSFKRDMSLDNRPPPSKSIIEGSIEIPILIFELRGDATDFGGKRKDLVRVSIQDFSICYKKRDPYKTNLDVILKSLIMEDLLEKDARHRRLMTSEQCCSTYNGSFKSGRTKVSTSCPDLRPLSSSFKFCSSLPNHLNIETILGLPLFSESSINDDAIRRGENSADTSNSVLNSSSISSKTDLRSDANLVHIKVESYETEGYEENCLNRFIDVDFNNLDIIFNIQTWAIIFNFFGIGSGGSKEVPSYASGSRSRYEQYQQKSSSSKSTKIDLNVKSLSVLLNKPEYELSKIGVNNFSAKMSSTNESFSIKGRLGNFFLKDLTPSGKLYSDRFISRKQSNQVLTFDFLKYEASDESLERSFDSSLSLRMASVIYVHTQRFYTELTSFIFKFNQLQRGLNRAKDISSPTNTNQAVSRDLRIKLNIEARSPILFLPMSSFSSRILTVDLGLLKLNNYFCFSGDPATISPETSLMTSTLKGFMGRKSRAQSCESLSSIRSLSRRRRTPRDESPEEGNHIVVNEVHNCLLDVLRINLKSVDLKMGNRISGFTDESSRTSEDIYVRGFIVRLSPRSLLKEKFELQLQVERNLDKTFSHRVPDLSIKGELTKVHVSIDSDQYETIRGLLAYNLGETIEEFNSLGLAEDNKKYQSTKSLSSENIWTQLFMNIELQDVVLDLEESKSAILARIHFLKSKLIYESYSDSSRDIDLVSQEICLSDCRYDNLVSEKRPNVFSQILYPMKNNLNSSSNLQVEVHYRSTPDTNRFTILLNNMRLLSIFDWWLGLLEFISKCPDPPTENSKDSQNKEVTRFVYLGEEPIYPTVGIISRRVPMIETNGPIFELKINITDSEVVIVADSSKLDSPTIILRSTTVIAYRPDMVERPFSCNLNNAEVFSCILGKDKSALSIVDPVTINFEIGRRTSSTNNFTKGLNNLNDDEVEKSAEIILQQLNLRLSYHDWIIFSYILNSFPKQAQAALDQRMVLEQEDCYSNMNEHSTFQDYEDYDDDSRLKETFLNGSRVSFSNIELKINAINICIIDDCRDADVPLLELSFGHVNLKHDVSKNGSVLCDIQASYYNRALSSWEPFIEPFQCKVDWNLMTRKIINFMSDNIVNINITHSLIELYEMVRISWTDDYYNQSDSVKQRTPFVPYALKNETGCDLMFSTHIHQASNHNEGGGGLLRKFSSKVQINQLQFQERTWILVTNGETLPFSFEERGKFRHLNSKEVKSHQILVRVEGWMELHPVSVDKVGTYFRNAKASPNYVHNVPPVRIVVDVSLEGPSRKLVKVRSALLVSNKLQYPLRLKLNNSSSRETMEMILSCSEVKSVPLKYVWSAIYGKPDIGEWRFCDKPIEWGHVKTPDKPSMVLYKCHHSWNKIQEPQRFCGAVQRIKFSLDSFSESNNWIQPAHLITFASPIKIMNLLPCHLIYNLKGSLLKGSIKPGLESCLSVDLSQQNTFNFSLDHFQGSPDVIISPNASTNFETRLRLIDSNNRPLYLQVNVIALYGGIVNISIFAPYWLVNKTGLPLIFREEKNVSSTIVGETITNESETLSVASGQDADHEIARNAAPLLFSFADESNLSLSMRIGTGVHPDSKPQWCKAFYAQPRSVCVRRLRVIPLESNRVERVYNIGVDIASGKGKFDKTLIVTFTPRFQLHNRSKYKILLAQKCQILDSRAPEMYLESPQGSSLSFHWPRLDKDQLLCIKMPEMLNSLWSGGFELEKPDSFQLMIRDAQGRGKNLRIEIALVGATYSVLFTDAESFPPPFRIDNFSHVSIAFFQNGTDIRSYVKPEQSSLYALDEPTLRPRLTCEAPGGSRATYDLNTIGEGPHLSYENFIYIALTSTFNGGSSCTGLVLDVEESKVVLSPKLAGKRSQLWRMTSKGQLQHEGSSPPQDPDNPNPLSETIVLDIAGPAVQPHTFVPLKLRKSDERRRLTQRWKFTSGGRLVCEHKGLYVQVKSDFKGTEVVLGPDECGNDSKEGQGFSRQRMRPGSGILSVKVLTDGPTRVLLISDAITPRKSLQRHYNGQNWSITHEQIKDSSMEYTVSLSLGRGLGISLVSSDPTEELCYGFFNNVIIECATRNNLIVFDGGVQSVQIDNQLFNSQCHSILYASPSTKKDEYRHMPAIHLTVAKQRYSRLIHNAEIYDHAILTLKNITLNLEEELICKILKWGRILDLTKPVETFAGRGNVFLPNSFEEGQEDMISNTITATRYYFGTLKVALNQVKLSVLKSNRLDGDLRIIQKKMNLSLVTFEDANIKLNPFIKIHPFETANFLLNSLLKHYQEELFSQALLILGSTDFLGNPAGLANDIMEGFWGMLRGNILNSLINVTHGAANSAAKFSGSLSYGISRLSLHENYDERRLMLRQRRGDNSMSHIIAGLKGLSFGAWGGITSVFEEPYGGAKNEGTAGFLNGLMWGLAGVVVKPTIGILDFATEAATAIKESSRTNSKLRPKRIRPPRLAFSSAGALPVFNLMDSLGQEKLYAINGRTSEIYIGEEILSVGRFESEILISSVRVFIYQKINPEGTSEEGKEKSEPIIVLNYEDLLSVKPFAEGNRCYLEFKGKEERPLRIFCDNEKIAYDVTTKVNYAFNFFLELKQALPLKENNYELEL